MLSSLFTKGTMTKTAGKKEKERKEKGMEGRKKDTQVKCFNMRWKLHSLILIHVLHLFNIYAHMCVYAQFLQRERSQ